MSLSVSASSSNPQYRIPLSSVKRKITKMCKTIPNQAPKILPAASLASALSAMFFLDRTGHDSKTMYLGGHWETHQPQDSSDYPYSVWVEDPKPLSQAYIHSSGDPDWDDNGSFSSVFDKDN